MTLNRCGQGRVWKNIIINNKDYTICFTKENESWKILLTNLKDIWTETLTDETMFRKCQNMNPLLNLEAFDWKQLVLDMLNDIPQYMYTHVLVVTDVVVKLRKEKDFVKLKFSLELHRGTPQQFWENVTMPLCLSSMELVRRHKTLLDLVKQKDEEIAEYKAGGAQLVRKYIATKPFSEELFHIDAAESAATDFVNTFQSMLHFSSSHNGVNLLKSHVKLESEVSSNNASGTNDLEIDGNVLLDSSRNENVQEIKQELDNEQGCSKAEEYIAGPSSSKTPILRISSTSHMIHKLKKNKKTLNDFIM